jgi:hypothetical protein
MERGVSKHYASYDVLARIRAGLVETPGCCGVLTHSMSREARSDKDGERHALVGGCSVGAMGVIGAL